MRLASLALVSSLFLACGGGGDDGGNVDGRRLDAFQGIDTAPLIDAGPGASGLGQLCGPAIGTCPTEAPQCTAVDAEIAIDGFCTLPCGDSSTGTLMPDHTICTAAYTGTAGVAACILADAMPATAYYCGVLCGTGTTPADDGPCPGGLTCSLNLQPGDPASEGCSD